MKYDIVVIGGGISGCAAAYTAAKRGLKTLLIEKNTFLGGSISAGLVVPAMKTSDNQINTNFFKQYLQTLNVLGGQITYLDNNSGWINPELTKIALEKLLKNVGVDIRLSTHVNEVTTSNTQIKSITISANELIKHKILSESIEPTNYSTNTTILSESIESKYYIDTTGNQVICNTVKCNFINDDGKSQPSSLRFTAGGINLEQFANFIVDLDPDRDATTSAYIDGQIHLSTACTWDKKWALSPLFNNAVEEGVLKPSDTAYFQVFTIPGMPDTLAFNCPRFTNSFDMQNTKMLTSTLIEARESIVRLIDFCRKYLSGCENAFISQIAPEIGCRVSKRALGKYYYTIEDLKTGKTFETPVLISNYPIDVHATKKENVVLEKVYKEYQLPVESLLSADYENLAFAGRGISADFFAQAALRIIPSCSSMGEGLANYLADLAD